MDLSDYNDESDLSDHSEASLDDGFEKKKIAQVMSKMLFKSGEILSQAKFEQINADADELPEIRNKDQQIKVSIL